MFPCIGAALLVVPCKQNNCAIGDKIDDYVSENMKDVQLTVGRTFDREVLSVDLQSDGQPVQPRIARSHTVSDSVVNDQAIVWVGNVEWIRNSGTLKLFRDPKNM